MAARALVTGGLGFIGRHVAEALLARGQVVRVLDLAPPAVAAEAFGGAVDYRRGSILDPAVLADAIDGVSTVFHLAAMPELWARDKSAFERVNHLGTRAVLEAAATAGVERVVHTSTEAVIGHGAGGAASEEAVGRLQDMPGQYCRAKFRAEAAARAYAERGLPVVIVNPTLPIGPGDFRLTPPTRMLLGFLNGRYPAFMESTFNIVDVRDAAEGHLAAAAEGRVGERYILGGHNIRLSELLELLERISGIAMPKRRVPYWLALASSAVTEVVADFITRRPPAAPLAGVRLARHPMTFSMAKAAAELGFKARPLEETLRDAVEWLAGQGLFQARRSTPRGRD